MIISQLILTWFIISFVILVSGLVIYTIDLAHRLPFDVHDVGEYAVISVIYSIVVGVVWCVICGIWRIPVWDNILL